MSLKNKAILLCLGIFCCWSPNLSAKKFQQRVVVRKWVTKLKQNTFFNRRPFQFAQPSVGDGKVFVGVHKEIFYAIDARRGGKIWKFKTHGPIHAPAVVDAKGEKVFFGDMEGVVYALLAETGEAQWMTRLPGPVMSAPLLVGSNLYIATLYKDLVALNGEDGKILWQVNFSGPDAPFSVKGSADPVLFEDKILVGYSDGALLAHRLEDGGLVWAKPLGDPLAEFRDVDAAVRPEILLEGPRAYVTSADGHLYNFNPRSGEVIWEAAVGGVNDVALGPSHLYVTAGGVLYCFQKESGRILWEQDLEVPEISSPVLYEDKLVTVATKGKAFFMNRKTGDVMYSWYVRGGSYSDPVLDGKRLYILSNASRLYAFEFR